MSMFLPPESVNVTSFGKGVFAGIIKLKILRHDSGFSESNDECPHKRHTEERHIGRREGHVKMNVETGIIPQAKKCLSHRKLKEARKDIPLRIFEESTARQISLFPSFGL